MIFNIALTLFFVFLNAFFVAAEFAIVKVRSSQIEMKIRSGNKIAGMAKNIITRLDSYLSATQLGITLASLGLGWIGESVVSGIILEIMFFFNIKLSPELSHSISLPIAFASITFLHIVFGELAPKSLAIQRPTQITMAVTLPLRLFYYIFSPFIWILNSFANLLIKLVGFEPISEEHEMHSPEELLLLIEESTKSGLLQPYEHKLLENVFEFSETSAESIMVPRNQIIGIDIDWSIDEIIEIVLEEGYSRMPVFRGNIDNIIGIIYAKDLINVITNRNLIILEDIIRPALFSSEDEKIDVLLKRLQQERVHIAIILDEFGGAAGLVTLEDIIEEIVGEIQDEYDEELPVVKQISETEFIVSAYASIPDVNEFLVKELPESDDYETVGGMINHYSGEIPEQDEIIDIEDYQCKILKRKERSLELVQLTLKTPENEESEE